MGLFSRVSNAVSNAVNKAPQVAAKTAVAIGSVVSLPAQVGGQATAQGLRGGALPALQATGEVVGEATSIIQENPLLAGLAGTALGVPGLGGLFSGGGGSTGGGAYPVTASTKAAGLPLWVWLAAAAAAVVGLFLVLRKKA